MVIDLLKLVGFGKEEDKEERSEHEKETKVLLCCACPETRALRGDMITAIHSDFKTGHGTYHYYTFFICIKQLLPWSVAAELSRQHASDGINDLRHTRLALN